MEQDMLPKEMEIKELKNNFHRLSDDFELKMKLADELTKTKRRHKDKIGDLRETYKAQSALTKQ